MTIVSVCLFYFSRVGCMCSLCWTTLQQEHRFSLECLLKPSASRGSTVRQRKGEEKQMIQVFMVGKADTILRGWWEICCYRCALPWWVIVLLETRILQLEGLFPLMVLASSVCVHVSSGTQIYFGAGTDESSVDFQWPEFWPLLVSPLCSVSSREPPHKINCSWETGNSHLTWTGVSCLIARL